MEVALFEWFESNAWAQAGGAAGPAGNPLISFLPFILIFVIFYFLLVLPQQKRTKKKKAMIDALKKGERVTTMGGLIGTVTNLSPEVVTIQIAEGVRVKVVRSYIEEVRTSESEGAEERAK
ncbi:MAG: preprotein translocase subunit YajC [Nitrospirae bacterium]|nr:preprotein translocase subunit YajC [Candidatus Manganitrophaceae bacterium]